MTLVLRNQRTAFLAGGFFTPDTTKRDVVPFQEPDQTKLAQGQTPNAATKWHLQVFHANSIHDWAITYARNNPTILAQWQWTVHPNFLLSYYGALIEQHVDRRVQLFFLQLISCYQTPFHFEWASAEDQLGKGVRGFTQAAHSSTLPCLHAYVREDWDNYRRGTALRPGCIVYLKHSHIYTQHNGTVELPECVNKADCLIDGKKGEAKLRDYCEALLNGVAQEQYDPRAAIRGFIDVFETILRNTIQSLLADELRANQVDPRRLVLEAYLQRALQFKWSLQNDPGIFDWLLGVNLTGHPREQLLRDVVYKRRFRLIQNCEALESQVARIILDGQNSLLGENSASLKEVDYRLRYVLLEEPDTLLRKKLEKLFCTSLTQLQAAFSTVTHPAAHQSAVQGLENTSRIAHFRRTHGVAVDNLRRTLRMKFRDFEGEELQYRAELFKGLRCDLNRWTQKQFAATFKAKYATEPMSASMVSRFEQPARISFKAGGYKTPITQRKKDIGIEKAKKIADIFGIDTGLFLPALLSSMY